MAVKNLPPGGNEKISIRKTTCLSPAKPDEFCFSEIFEWPQANFFRALIFWFFLIKQKEHRNKFFIKLKIRQSLWREKTCPANEVRWDRLPKAKKI